MEKMGEKQENKQENSVVAEMFFLISTSVKNFPQINKKMAHLQKSIPQIKAIFDLASAKIIPHIFLWQIIKINN